MVLIHKLDVMKEANTTNIRGRLMKMLLCFSWRKSLSKIVEQMKPARFIGTEINFIP
jgi:hypothetical protein